MQWDWRRYPATSRSWTRLLCPPTRRSGSGTLDNGYTYYLRHNDKPGNSATLRLVVKAGSINEPKPELGMAHFLEHMLFRGTEAYTAEEFNTTLRSLGVEFGPDLNAGVWYDQTVYELTVNTDSAENVSTALHVLSQMGHAALIEPEAVESERGVVLDEARFRTATASGQISVAFDRVYTQGTPYEGYYPIGTGSGIELTTAEDLREFYKTWYVPSNMAIVVVGDLPADEFYALVEQHFGSIEPGTAPDFSLAEITPDRAASYDVVTDGRIWSLLHLARHPDPDVRLRHRGRGPSPHDGEPGRHDGSEPTRRRLLSR